MHNRILKYLSNKGVELHPSADNRKKFTLRDDSDGKGPYIETWNVRGVDKPTVSQLPTVETAESWAKGVRNADKISEAAFDAATLDELKVLLKPCIEKLNMFEEK